MVFEDVFELQSGMVGYDEIMGLLEKESTYTITALALKYRALQGW